MPLVRPATHPSTAVRSGRSVRANSVTAASQSDRDAWRDLEENAMRTSSGLLYGSVVEDVFESVASGELVLDCKIEELLDVLVGQRHLGALR